MLLENIGESFVRQFLNGRHPVAPQLLQLVESIVVEGDQLAHMPVPAPASLARLKARRRKIVPRVISRIAAVLLRSKSKAAAGYTNP
jgi:hypothetical protein